MIADVMLNTVSWRFKAKEEIVYLDLFSRNVEWEK